MANLEEGGTYANVTKFDLKKSLDTEFGNILPDEIQTGILDLVEKHHEDKSGNCDKKAEILVFDVLQYLCNHSYSEFFQGQKNVCIVEKKCCNNEKSECHKNICQEVFDEKLKVVDSTCRKRTADDKNGDQSFQTPVISHDLAKCQVNIRQRRFYFLICKLGSNKFKNIEAIKIANVKFSFKCLFESLQPSGHVDKLVIAAYCCKFFDELHPYTSKKYYFSPDVGEALLNSGTESADKFLEQTFGYVYSMQFHHCNLLYFPICLKSEWFLFIVDKKNSLFVFIVSSNEKSDLLNVSHVLVQAFKELWSRFFKNHQLPFHKYNILYPSTPSELNRNDFGVFVMKSLDLWTDPTVSLRSIISHYDIPNMRIRLLNDLFFSPFNEADKSLVYDIYNQVSAAVIASCPKK